ncbi:co-chaperone DjlA [Sansalvadorimonas sp. 2012CJ34-2]|uniref:Co-chaperone protein DjlA n=1 Tax=Parendozoicomonas callyspongiae TaxID=2942213 RepID=A0ABT0PLE9_9GAMM|nr:co-chaperone DjlA [Sansalvadorimonas sp. 2012CJ34-2]MCL6271811.1 co-chaperone DjlA [Sansalvadorimonas sp. 2012CJ34-2]
MWFRTVFLGFLGFLFGGPFGAIVGALFGAWLDNQNQGPRMVYGRQSAERQRQTQTAFFEATFLVMGKLAKSDGVVNESEIKVAEALMGQMRLTSEQRRQAIHFFNQGKNGEPVEAVLRRFREYAGNSSLIQMFLEIQLQAAYADGEMSPSEQGVLYEACHFLGINNFAFDLLHKRFQAQRNFYSHHTGQGQGGYQQQGGWQRTSSRNELKEAYATLGVSPDASDRDVKRAYRKLMSEHHPDKLVAKGLPEEMMEVAKRKTQEIQAAYDLVQQHRKRNS